VPEVDAKRDIARTLFREARAAEFAQAAARDALTRVRGGADLAAVATELRTAALREFYRGEVPAVTTPPAGAPAPAVTLTPLERSDLELPELRDSEQFARNGMMLQDVDNPDALTQAAFRLTEAAPLSPEPVHVGDDWFVLRYKDNSRTTATREEFARQRQEQLSQSPLLVARQREALVVYINRLRSSAEHAGQVTLGNSERIRPPSGDAGASADDDNN
jgi:hypothetical protein